MEHRRALQLAVCAATIAFALAFGYPSVRPQAVLWYYPLEHRWAYEVRSHGLAMDFYGRVLLGAIAGAISGGAAYTLFRKVRERGALFGLFTAWAITATLLVAANYGWTLYFRHPTPAPLPADDQPR